MSAAKHLEGPWLRDGRTVYALTPDGTRNRFCAGVQDAHTSEAELLDIARLMQAAPALLAALRPFAEPHWFGDNYVQFHPRLLAAARVAIAAATGEPTP